jgi:O-antigen/teichoic acid export membrane protein
MTPLDSTKKQSAHYNPSREIVRGVSWALLMRWSIKAVGLVSTMILARLLSPEDFGVAAICMLVSGLLYAITEFGASMLLIRTKNIDRAHCDTAWTVTLIQSLFVGAMIVLLAPIAAVYFNEPRVIEVMYVLAFATFVNGLESIGPILIRRELKFEVDFRFNVYLRLLEFFATVGLALFFRSYWALVFGYLIGNIASVILSYIIHSYRPSWSLARASEYLRFALSIIPMRMANDLNEFAPKFLVGSLGSAQSMGTFTVSDGLASIFTIEIVTPMGRGLLPNYTRLANDKIRLSEEYKKVLAIVMLLVIPVGIGISAIADDLVTVILGSQWDMAKPLVKYLAIGGMLVAVTSIMYNQILVATGREQKAAILAWVRLMITVPILLAGLTYGGVIGLAKATIIAPLIYLPLIYMETRQAVNLPISAIGGLVWRPMLGGVVMYMVIKLLHPEGLEWATLRLACDIVIGAFVYGATIFILWLLSKRPQGAEQICINALAKWTKWYRG